MQTNTSGQVRPLPADRVRQLCSVSKYGRQRAACLLLCTACQAASPAPSAYLDRQIEAEIEIEMGMRLPAAVSKRRRYEEGISGTGTTRGEQDCANNGTQLMR